MRVTIWSLPGGARALRLSAAEAEGWSLGDAGAEEVLDAAMLTRPALSLALDPAVPVSPSGGLLATAALDLAARERKIPAALLLGAAQPAQIEAASAEAPAAPREAAALRAALLDPATLILSAEPGSLGPSGLRRLAAAARVFNVEVALRPASNHVFTAAMLLHLRATHPWLGRTPPDGTGLLAAPPGPGFGPPPDPAALDALALGRAECGA
ncbi:hypothetical protein [Roseomonas chloroacetimidivorans]|uniref:hypothetical protein n=1 Tax=Roseomonas chloroacetimidivorans TaxID=1766656 RepID=UPI003C790312